MYIEEQLHDIIKNFKKSLCIIRVYTYKYLSIIFTKQLLIHYTCVQNNVFVDPIELNLSTQPIYDATISCIEIIWSANQPIVCN